MTSNQLPNWNPRVPQAWVRRFYENDARGIPDDELIDELGYALLARCRSFIAAVLATRGQAMCPLCGKTVPHDHKTVRCDECDWEVAWKDYFSTIQNKQLSGAEPVLACFREYCERFPLAKNARDKTLAIDRLIHGWHWNQGHTTRPVAINLMEGRLSEVVHFLDELAYGPGSTEGLKVQFEEWKAKSSPVRAWMPVKSTARKPRR